MRKTSLIVNSPVNRQVSNNSWQTMILSNKFYELEQQDSDLYIWQMKNLCKLFCSTRPLSRSIVTRPAEQGWVPSMKSNFEGCHMAFCSSPQMVEVTLGFLRVQFCMQENLTPHHLIMRVCIKRSSCVTTSTSSATSTSTCTYLCSSSTSGWLLLQERPSVGDAWL